MNAAVEAGPPTPHAVARVLLVEDDRKLARLLSDYLGGNGLIVSCAHDGAEGYARARSEPWDLVVLDVMLPGMDGLAILQRLREEQRTLPILMLTARGGEPERISGLEGGADDYLPKTVSARELLARIRALLRRAGAAPAATVAPATLEIGGLSLNVTARSARLKGAELPLTPVEFDLLLTLAHHRGRVCSREQLLEQVRDRSFDGGDRSIDVHVASLRRKLGDDPKAPHYIRTVRLAGYLLMDPDAGA